MFRALALTILAFHLGALANAPRIDAEADEPEPGVELGEEPVELHGNARALTPPIPVAPRGDSVPLRPGLDWASASRNFQSAEREFLIGAGMTYGGLALGLASPFLGGMGEISESIGTWAFVAYVVGEPIMGTAASTLHRVAMDMPGYRDPGGGWGFYASGWVLKAAGAVWTFVVILSSMDANFIGSAPVPYPNLTWEDLALPLAVMGSGVLCEGIALYKFHARRAAARKVLQGRMSWVPDFRWDPAAGLRSGAKVSLAY